MKKFLLLALAALMLTTAILAPASASGADAGAAFMELLAGGAYAEAFDRSDDAMRGAVMSAEGYAAMWQGLLLQFGEYEGAQDLGASEAGGYATHDVQASFARARVRFDVIFNSEGKLAGMRVTALEAREAEREQTGEVVLLRAGAQDETEALLTVPEGPGPFPVVILLSGSGPNDRDESAYGMAPFRDLAQGLAARGVATLRYDKYTLAHRDLLAADPARAASFTMKEEYVDDALAAFRALAEDARFSGTFLLGHSQGASAAPRVAAELPEGSVRGIILLAGTPLSIADLMYRQNMDALAAMNLPAEQDAQVRAQLDAERAKQAAVGGMTEAELKSTYLYGALSGWYLKDEAEHAPAPLLKNMDVPLLVVQGGKDWQVKPGEGMDLWREALAENNAQFLTFPDMTHFLFDLEGPSAGSAADYLQPRPVSEALMDALAEWVLSLQVTVR